MVTRHETYDLSQRNTFGMKVSCRLYVEVTEPEDLLTLDFSSLPQPLFVMGGGSNLLFTRDFPGTVLHMGNRFLHPSGVRNDSRATGVRNDSGATGVRNDSRATGARNDSRATGVRNDSGATGVRNDKGALPVVPGDISVISSVISVVPSEAKESLSVRVAAGVVFDDFCAWAASEGLWGPENLSLIPGEVGASAVQNIGAYGVEAKDIIDTVHAFDLSTRTFVDIPGVDCGYGYRTSLFKTDWKGRYIITAVTFRLSTVPQPKLDYGGVRKALEARFLDSALPGSARNDKNTSVISTKAGGDAFVISTKAEGDSPVISTKAEGCVEKSVTPQMIRDTIIAIREKKLPDPKVIGSAGSFFCNPVIERAHFERIVAIAKAENGPDYEVPHYDVGERVKVPAAWMIDQCGFKGARLGGAQVYPNQPLVIVNATGEATPEEIIALEQRVIGTIRDKYGIELHPEVEHV